MAPWVTPPLISVILPVYNGDATLDRAMRSVYCQTFPHWEIVAVDDGSTDGSYDVLVRWAVEDKRIRPIRLDENGGVSAARNSAIRNARGLFITYLDQDDEYYPDHLAHVAQFAEQADVLAFSYDFFYEDGPANGRLSEWNPGSISDNFFTINISVPLGIAHRRELWAKVGGFNEMWCEEDWDFWKRLARAGAEFVFLPLKSGCFHVSPHSASRVPHITRKQRDSFLSNWKARNPLYGDKTLGPTPRQVRRIAYGSPHCLADPVSGAAVATLQGMRLLKDAWL